MKKGTAIAIFIIYLASIVVIGFFGIKVRVYNEVTYIEKVAVKVEAETGVCKLSTESSGEEEATGYKKYTLKVYYTKFGKYGDFLDNNNNKVSKKYVNFSFVPVFSLKNGEDVEMTGDKVKYTLRNESELNKGNITLSESGLMTVFKSGITFTLCIEPITSGNMRTLPGAGIIIVVVVG